MNESMDRVLGDWLREGPEQGPREGLERALAATRRVGQKPGWALPERWLPMQLTMARTPSLRPILAIVMVALLTLALVAAALFIGSQRRAVPPPFGPARNGAIAFEQDGDLLIADALEGVPRTLVAGPESDSAPSFSNQGDRVAFIRELSEGFGVMAVRPDGSQLTQLATLAGSFEGYRWSPDGSAILVNHTENGIAGLRLTVVKADGSGSSAVDLGRPADWASWGPDGKLAFRGKLDDGTAGVFVADADGTEAQQLPIKSAFDVDFEGLGWAPVGTRLAYMSRDADAGTGWQIGIADLAPDGSLAKVRFSPFVPGATHERLPVWSPDGNRIAFLLEEDGERTVAVARADGSGEAQRIGPVVAASSILGYTWSPDGRTLLIAAWPDNNPAARTFWSVDASTGEETEIQTPVSSWQRLAP